MSPSAMGALVFACTFAGALLGMKLRSVLPERHLGEQARDTVKLGIGLIATITALILGLVTASAKESFDAAERAIKEAAAAVLSLDRVLARYGPETAEIRGALKHAVADRIDLIWSRRSVKGSFDPGRLAGEAELLPAHIRHLEPRTDEQRWLRSLGLEMAESMLRIRWNVTVGVGTSIRGAFLVVLLFWLTVTFASFGLLGDRNATVVTVLFVCALSVAGAVFLVLELDQPFQGMIMVSPDPLEYALAHLNR